MRFQARTFNVATQKEALRELAELVARSVEQDPIVRQTALRLTNGCQSRDDSCEIQAIFDAVKHGSPLVKSLNKGMKYVSDPRVSDYFVRPGKQLELCGLGACGSDCDDHAALISAMLCSIGFVVGLRAYAPSSSPDEFIHVYAVVGYPKNNPTEFLGLDTTVEESYVGWEPPRGRVLTAEIR